MAQRKRKTTVKRGFMTQLGKTAIKGAAGGVLGATVGVIEETVSPRAGNIAKAAIVAVGIAGEMFIDPTKRPWLAEGAKASLYTGTGVAGYDVGKRAGRAANEAKHKRDMARIRADLEAEGYSEDHNEDQATLTEGGDVVPVPKKRKRKAATNGAVAEQ